GGAFGRGVSTAEANRSTRSVTLGRAGDFFSLAAVPAALCSVTTRRGERNGLIERTTPLHNARSSSVNRRRVMAEECQAIPPNSSHSGVAAAAALRLPPRPDRAPAAPAWQSGPDV